MSKFNYTEWLKDCDLTNPQIVLYKIKEIVNMNDLEPEQILYGIHKVNDINLNMFFEKNKQDIVKSSKRKETVKKLILDNQILLCELKRRKCDTNKLLSYVKEQLEKDSDKHITDIIKSMTNEDTKFNIEPKVEEEPPKKKRIVVVKRK